MKKYEILEKLGQGGMGVVYKAFQKNLNREVAIKILPKAYSENPEVKRRFVSEMQICGGLVHPNIIRIYDNGEQEGTLYYVMEYIQGTTLLELVQSKGAMAVEQALKVTSDLLEAMKYYHPMGLVHRDIKPANIMVKPVTNEAVLMDFGLVKALYASGITIQGRLVGTPRYMSPEMLRGGAIDGRSDIFQLGLVLYEMVTGVPAFRGKDRQEVTRKLLEEEPERPSQLNPLLDLSMEHLLANAIDKNIDSRYQSADEMLDDLQIVRDGGRIARRAGARPIKALSASKEMPDATASDSSTDGEPVSGVSGPQRASRSTVAIEPAGSDLAATLGKVLFGFLATLVLAVAALMWPGMRPSYSAKDVACEPDLRSARIRWQSDTPYSTRLEYGESESLLQVYEPSEDNPPRTTHSATLKGLQEGTEYVYRLLYPDRQHSALYTFQTQSVTFTAASVRRTGLDGVEVRAQTSADVRTRLEFKRGDEEGVQEGPKPSSRNHRFALDKLGLDRPVKVRVVAVSDGGAEKPGDWLEVPAPIALSRVLAEGARKFPAKDWIERCEKMLAAKVSPQQVAQQLEESWKRDPLPRLMRTFQEIGPAFMESRDVPLADKTDLYQSMAAVADFNHYCDARGVPFHAPLEECAPSGFSEAAQARLPLTEAYERKIVTPFGFTPGGLGKNAGAGGKPPDALVTVKLERSREVKSAELLLGVAVEDPLAVFTVQINGRLTLRLHQPAAMLGRPGAALYHTFDARVLQDGENRFVVQLTSVPGHAMARFSSPQLLALLVRRN